MLRQVTKKTKNGLRKRDYYNESKNNLLKQSESLKNIKFIACDYNKLKLASFTTNKCLIYCDPPYKNVKSYANSQTFSHKKFWQTMREWSKNHIVIISEQVAPDDFECIWKQDVSRSINASNKSISTEKLFKYKG